MTQHRYSWVVAGGKIGESAHCERCGRGLEIGTQPIAIAVAAMNAFIGMHKGCKVGRFKEPDAITPQDWLRGRDTGTSSLTIYAVMMNTPSPHNRYDVPHDPDDFSRCYRLLNLFPKWKARLGDVAARFPIWNPFVREWDKLTTMYETAMKTPNEPAHEMYVFMQSLRKGEE